MTGNSKNLVSMIHQTHDMLKNCEDKMFGEYKLSSEQYSVLMAIKHIDGPVRPTDVARWLTRSPNSISMMVDRMVKAGLVRRVRDRKDRREVRLAITASADARLRPAVLADQGFIGEVSSVLSPGDKLLLVNRLEMLQLKASEYLNPVSQL